MSRRRTGAVVAMPGRIGLCLQSGINTLLLGLGVFALTRDVGLKAHLSTLPISIVCVAAFAGLVAPLAVLYINRVADLASDDAQALRMLWRTGIYVNAVGTIVGAVVLGLGAVIMFLGGTMMMMGASSEQLAKAGNDFKLLFLLACLASISGITALITAIVGRPRAGQDTRPS